MEKISKSYSKFTEPNIEHIDGDKDITEISKELLFKTKTFLEEHGIKTKANRIKR